MNINYDSPFNFKPIPAITPLDGNWKNDTWKFNMSEISAGATYQPSWIDIILHGNTALTLVNARANGLNYLKLFGGTEQNGIPTPQTPIDIVCNNGALKVRNKSGLPIGYQRIEYLESTGTQYIDTGIVLKSEATIETVTELTQINWSAGPYSFWGFMATGTMPRWGWSVYQNRWLSDLNSTTQVYSPVVDRNKHTFTNTCYYNQGGNLVYDSIVDSVSVYEGPRRVDSTEYYTSNTLSAYIFARNNANVAGNFIGAKIYSYKIIQDGILVLDLIPCKRISDNVLGMYDLVSNTFLTNQGTDNFTAGDDVDDLEIYTDGTVETVEAHSKNLYTGLISQFTNQGGIGTTYDYFKLPKENTNYTLSCICKKDYVGSAAVFFGFSGNGGDANNSVVWAVSAKMSSNKGDVITVNNVFDGRTLNFVSLYMKGQGTLDTLAEYYDIQLEEGSTATAYEPYYYGGSATAEMLLSLDDYKDVQNVTSGAVTRNVGIKVLNGSETWSYYSVTQGNLFRIIISDSVSGSKNVLGVLCNQYKVVGNRTDLTLSGTARNYDFINNNYTDLTDWGAYVAQQYANGTPIIIVYPLEEPTTENVTPQPMNIQAGTNIVEITQASIDDLELEVKYQAGVAVTITEIQNAQLDNNVEVTIQ